MTRAYRSTVTSFSNRPRSRAWQRGFTLAELMIVVAIIGVMAAIAIVSFKKYINYAQASEAKGVITGIRAGEEAYRAEMLVYLGCSGTAFSSTYYPNPTPNDTKWNWVRPSDTAYTGCWQKLNVQPEAPVRFGYQLVAGVGPTPAPPTLSISPAPAGWPPTVIAGTPWYVVQATNQRNSNPNVYFVSSSFSGEIIAQNDDK